MLEYETLTFGLAKVRRIHAPIKSPTLLALPEAARPATLLACTSCPDGSWNFSEDNRLACHCAARHYVSWVTDQKMIAMCDDREAALTEQDLKPEG